MQHIQYVLRRGQGKRDAGPPLQAGPAVVPAVVHGADGGQRPSSFSLSIGALIRFYGESRHFSDIGAANLVCSRDGVAAVGIIYDTFLWTLLNVSLSANCFCHVVRLKHLLPLPLLQRVGEAAGLSGSCRQSFSYCPPRFLWLVIADMRQLGEEHLVLVVPVTALVAFSLPAPLLRFLSLSLDAERETQSVVVTGLVRVLVAVTAWVNECSCSSPPASEV